MAAKLTGEGLKIVAWLLDVLEDTDASESDLRHQFGDAIGDAVVAITRRDGEAPHDYCARVRSNDFARAVKLADVHDVAHSCVGTMIRPSRTLAADEGASSGQALQKYRRGVSASTAHSMPSSPQTSIAADSSGGYGNQQSILRIRTIYVVGGLAEHGYESLTAIRTVQQPHDEVSVVDGPRILLQRSQRRAHARGALEETPTTTVLHDALEYIGQKAAAPALVRQRHALT